MLSAAREKHLFEITDPSLFARVVELATQHTFAVLLDGTPMPEPEYLPDDLVRRQAEFVDFRTFDADVERLIKRPGIETRIAEVAKRQNT